LNLTGWKAYFFDDLNAGHAGISPFQGFNMKWLKKFNYLSPIERHQIITKGPSFTVFNQDRLVDEYENKIWNFLNPQAKK
jgi:hypothetical protein